MRQLVKRHPQDGEKLTETDTVVAWTWFVPTPGRTTYHQAVMSQSKPLPPIHLLWERYSLNPLTGKFHSRKTGKVIQGGKDVKRKQLQMRITWDARSYATSYGRAVLAFTQGKWPVDQTDHIDRNAFNNRPWNLREVTGRQNIQNRSNFGGTWVARYSVWQAQIRIGGKVKWLGYHRTQKLAAAAYWQAVEQYGFADVRTAAPSFVQKSAP